MISSTTIEHSKVENNHPTLETLQHLRPLVEFNSEQLLALAKELNIQTADNEDEILALGSIEASSLFVLEGDVKVTSRYGQEFVKSVPNGLLTPISQLRPSMYQIQAIETVQYLKISKALLTLYSCFGSDEEVEVEIIEDDSVLTDITLSIFKDMMNDQLSLPSLPEIALKIQRVYKDDLADINSIADLIMADPAISAKLIKTANSLVYRGEVPTKTLKNAISRLGLNTTYKQVMSYAVNDLFKSSSNQLKKKMDRLWAHSRKVAAISYLLAQETKLFNPEHAMLAGLVHDLGSFVILEYLEKTNFEASDELSGSKVVEKLRPVVTGMLMKKWNFSEDVQTVAEECEDWFRNPQDEADLCDLIMVAQYHSYIGIATDEGKKLPLITSMSAMKKLGLTPQVSIALMKNSKDKIKAMEALFS